MNIVALTGACQVSLPYSSEGTLDDAKCIVCPKALFESTQLSIYDELPARQLSLSSPWLMLLEAGTGIMISMRS